VEGALRMRSPGAAARRPVRLLHSRAALRAQPRLPVTARWAVQRRSCRACPAGYPTPAGRVAWTQHIRQCRRAPSSPVRRVHPASSWRLWRDARGRGRRRTRRTWTRCSTWRPCAPRWRRACGRWSPSCTRRARALAPLLRSLHPARSAQAANAAAGPCISRSTNFADASACAGLAPY